MNPKFRHIILAFILLLAGCANRGMGPQGGPKDETPPVIGKSTPANGATNWTKKRIEVEFDENIQVDNPGEKVVISPAQRKAPLIQAIGKRLVVTFVDTLQANTTYTIDFADAIKDLNEGNIFPDYSFTFSTGNQIDSLRISGHLLDAESLSPMKNVYVGLYRDDETWNDSTVMKQPMIRVGKTNDKGRFMVSGVSEGTYHIIGLKDDSRDYMYQVGEAIAMQEATVTPSCAPGIRRDTVWKDSVTIDSIRETNITEYKPNDILLRCFKENNRRQYLVRAERSKPQCFSLVFNAPLKELPVLTDADSLKWINQLLLQANATQDTLTYWIKDSTIYQHDTLRFVCRYEKTDSLGELKPQQDTLMALYRKPLVNAKAKKQTKPKQVEAELKTTAKNPFEIGSRLIISCATPIDSIYPERMHLTQKMDTGKVALNFELKVAEENNGSYAMRYEVVYGWEAGSQYDLAIDSGAVVDIYGMACKKSSHTMKVRNTEEYATLAVQVTGQNGPFVVQLLNAKDEVQRSLSTTNGNVMFQNILAGDYYLRCFSDDNNDGCWTTGCYLEHRQPEQVYYYPTKLSLRANWDFEEIWDLNIIPPLQQKPDDIKPQEKK